VTYSTARVTEVSTIVLEGEIGPAMVIAMHRQVCDALPGGRRQVVVDLRAVTVLGGQTASSFCAVLRRLTHRGATLDIVGAPAPVARVLELSAIPGLEIHPIAGGAARLHTGVESATSQASYA
jgi:anti-anti-sigma regulatory factor